MTWPVSAFADEAGDSCEEQIEALGKAGLRHIDIRLMDGFNITAMPVEHAQEVRRKLDAAGITVAMFGTPIGKIDITEDIDIDLEKLRHLGELAPVLGCNACRIFSYFNQEGRSHDEWQRESLNRLRQLRDLAAELGLVLYHENERHIYGDLGDDVLAIAHELRNGGNSVFRTIFDFDNYNQSGENVWENWLKLRNYTDAIHLKDSREGQHCPVGQGTGYVREILADAVERGWQGSLAIEPHLSHSGAVAATGPSGEANQEYGRMAPQDSFLVACKAARGLLSQVKAPVA
jgi:sugar phosphate isomerase/epimerase